MELIRAAEILIEKIKKDYKDDIALVVVMGSYIYGETHSRSDLDMFYVPKTDRGKNLGFTFILDGIGFDYWAISWERLERIANCEEKTTSIITEGRVLYCASEGDMERFDELKRKALDTTDRRRFVSKAIEKIDEAYEDCFGLLKAQNLADARMCAIGIIYTVTYALALLNRITVKRGRGKLKQEIMDMPLVPADFSELYDVIFVSTDIDLIRDSYGKLIENTKALILSEQEKVSEPIAFSEALNGFYEELINLYNKIYHACEIGDAYCALFACVELTYEIAQVLVGTGVSPKQLPDIVGAFDPSNLELFAASVHDHQTEFVELLTTQGVKIRRFDSFDELEETMNLL